jgi:hypothetical protein
MRKYFELQSAAAHDTHEGFSRRLARYRLHSSPALSRTPVGWLETAAQLEVLDAKINNRYYLHQYLQVCEIQMADLLKDSTEATALTELAAQVCKMCLADGKPLFT